LIASVASDDSTDRRSSAEAAVAAAIKVAQRLGVAADTRVLAGRPAERIADLASDTAADLLVVGRRGESDVLQRALLGGTAQRIAALAQCPVLVVKT
jgi:nucleotide-binding universal stress UspA family protein